MRIESFGLILHLRRIVSVIAVNRRLILNLTDCRDVGNFSLSRNQAPVGTGPVFVMWRWLRLAMAAELSVIAKARRLRVLEVWDISNMSGGSVRYTWCGISVPDIVSVIMRRHRVRFARSAVVSVITKARRLRVPVAGTGARVLPMIVTKRSTLPVRLRRFDSAISWEMLIIMGIPGMAI